LLSQAVLKTADTADTEGMFGKSKRNLEKKGKKTMNEFNNTIETRESDCKLGSLMPTSSKLAAACWNHSCDTDAFKSAA